jgi:CHAT domain-containing protein/tetratricopeptide (TPR) repeat protein
MFDRYLVGVTAAALLICVNLSFASSTTRGQTSAETLLATNKTVNRQINSGEIQSFEISLAEGQYAEVVFEWQGINLSVALFDPDGAKSISSYVQVSAPGPVRVSILAEKSGTYKLQVTTPVKQNISGKYELKLEEPRIPSAADRNRVVAQNLIAGGQKASTTDARIHHYHQALELLRQAADLNAEASVQMLLGDAYKAGGKPEKARTCYEQAAEIWNKTSYPRGEAYAKVALGLLFRRSVLPTALVYYQQAELLFTQIGDRLGQADALYGHAFTLMLIGHTARAIDPLQRTLSIRRTIGDQMGEASTLNMLSDAYRVLGDYEKALSLYDQASKALIGLEHHSLEVTVINNRAMVYDDQGYWQHAKDEYVRVLTLYESLLGQPVLSACQMSPSSKDAPICRAAANVLINFGEVYNSLGNPKSAQAEFHQSLKISEVLNDSAGEGLAKFHLGYAQFLLGDHAKALEYYKAALAIQTAAGAEKDAALTNTYMGMVYIARNEPHLALKLYEDALPILETAGDKRALAIAVDKLGTAYSRSGDPKKASAAYSRATDLWRTIRDPDGEALTLSNMARAQQLAGNLSLANQHSEAALHLVESLRTRLTSQQLRVSYFADKQDYYQLDVDLKMLLSESLKDIEYVKSAFESNERARTRNLLDALSEGRFEVNKTSDPRLAGLFEQRLTLLGKLADKARARSKLLSSGSSPAQTAAIDNDINKITESYDQVETRLRTQSPRFANLTKPRLATVAEIQQELDADTVLLEYSLGSSRSYVWVVSPDSIQVEELPGRNEIEVAANRLVNALTARSRNQENESRQQRLSRVSKAEADYPKASAALSKIVIDPIASHLDRKRLVVVADGALQFVPFSALVIPNAEAMAQGKRSTGTASGISPGKTTHLPLISKYEIVTQPSASVLALQRRELASRKPAPLAIAILADPVFDANDERVTKASAKSGDGGVALQAQPPSSPSAVAPANLTASQALSEALRSIGGREISWLPFSRQEALAIMKVAPKGETFAALDFNASRETAISPSLARYRIVHVATHGVMDIEHPELSGIVLSMVDDKGKSVDGYLRLHEIYGLNLPAELVVLSACQTGVGKQVKGEGLIALTRGFMYAGARSVVASYWKVDDKATSELMAEFYRQMFVNKLRPAAALRAAQMKISQEKRWSSPHYWAGFFLQGEWN